MEDIPPFILADSVYSNTKHMVTTFKTTECVRDPEICALNKKLGGARYHVENAFGILKRQFQIFKQALECSHEDVLLAIVLTASIMIIHNVLIEVNDDLNAYSGSYHEMDTKHDMSENRDDDNYDVEDKICQCVQSY